MSLDTVQRVNAYFKSAIADTYSYSTIYDNENKDLPQDNVGPNIRVFVEVGNDDLLSDGGEYEEDGVVIAQIEVEVGKSATQLHLIATQIRDAFRQKKLTATGGEQGDIYFESIENVTRGEISRKPVRRARNQSTRNWKRLDVLMTYTKYCA